ncbi:MAG TPA: alpha/beta hydrolase [Cyclobacteriaceae bacterium]|nr:alpha/beta hydrolase [Cyclobacteriaceae bacterium]
MKKEIFFIHSAGPQSEQAGSTGLVKYLKGSLGSNYVLHHPSMPDPENPRYIEWKMMLQATLPVGGNKVAIIGHSLGGSVIVKYLSEGLCQLPVAGLFLVGVPYWGTRGWAVDEFMYGSDFVSKLPDIDKVFIYHSRNDRWVPFSHAEAYAKKLNGSVVRKLTGDDHEFPCGLPVLVKDINDLSF